MGGGWMHNVLSNAVTFRVVGSWATLPIYPSIVRAWDGPTSTTHLIPRSFLLQSAKASHHVGTYNV